MSVNNPIPVVVGVGRDPMDAALRYAVAGASRAGCGIHLLHVMHQVAQGPETVLVATGDLERAGASLLALAERRTLDLAADGVPVTTEIVWGGVVSSIVARADDARLIVLQRRSLSRLRRVVTRSVSSGVASHARVPVVSVPARWSPVRSTGDVPVVSVGVDVPDRSEHVIRVAAHEARGRGARLRVIHTWGFPGVYDDMIMTRTEGDEWSSRATLEIQAVLDTCAEDLVGVEVEVEARHAPAADALIEAGRTSELLVVGRHDSLVPMGSHLGPVARAVLREATCPVLLADPRPGRHWRGHRERTETVQPV